MTALYLSSQSVVISTQPQNQNITVGGNAQFYVTTSATSPTFQWQQDAGTGFLNLSNAGPYSGVFTNTLMISNVTLSMNNYNYRCIVSQGSGCEDTSSAGVLTVVTGINELNNQFQISVFPNPTSNIFTITTQLKNSQLEIYNVLGEKIHQQNISSPKTEINLSNHPDGIYFVQLRNNEQTVTRKIILSK